MGQGALSKPVVQWWLSLNSSKESSHAPREEDRATDHAHGLTHKLYGVCDS